MSGTCVTGNTTGTVMRAFSNLEKDIRSRYFVSSEAEGGAEAMVTSAEKLGECVPVLVVLCGCE